MTSTVRTLCIAVLLVLGVSGCKSADRQQNLNDMITVLNEQGVVWEGEVAGPLDAGFEMYSGGRVTSGGWIKLRVQSPVQNPAANYLNQTGGTDNGASEVRSDDEQN